MLGDVAGAGEDAAHGAGRILEDRGVERYLQVSAIAGGQRQHVVGHDAALEGLVDTGRGPLRIHEVVGERRADELLAGIAGHAAHLLVDVGDGAGRVDGDQAVNRGLDQPTVVGLGLAQLLFELLLLGDVAGGGEDALQLPGGVAEGGGIVRHYGHAACFGEAR